MDAIFIEAVIKQDMYKMVYCSVIVCDCSLFLRTLIKHEQKYGLVKIYLCIPFSLVTGVVQEQNLMGVKVKYFVWLFAYTHQSSCKFVHRHYSLCLL